MPVCEHHPAMNDSNFSGPRPAKGLLSHCLARELAHLEQIRNVDAVLREFLDPALGKHCNVANVAPERITLHVDSAAWHARIRFCVPQLQDYLRQHCPHYQHATLELRIAPAGIPGQPAQKPAAPLSAKTREFLQNVAQTSENPRLRDALLRLCAPQKDTPSA